MFDSMALWLFFDIEYVLNMFWREEAALSWATTCNLHMKQDVPSIIYLWWVYCTWYKVSYEPSIISDEQEKSQLERWDHNIRNTSVFLCIYSHEL